MRTQMQQRISLYLDVLGETFAQACERLGMEGVDDPSQLTRAKQETVCEALRRRARKLQRGRLSEEQAARKARTTHTPVRHVAPDEQALKEAHAKRVRTSSGERWMSQPITDAQHVYLATHLTMSELMSATERLCGLEGVTWPSQLTRGQAAEVISWWEEVCK